ncbi:MAG TPA: hypothetical protein VJ028_01290, partial [Patescibacteria group bacterium]|nr:hypothetical protein [Patescibacteria group bacterium]
MKIPKTIPFDREGQYCFSCFSPSIKRIFQNNLTYYHCSACNKTIERSLVIDDAIAWRVDKD